MIVWMQPVTMDQLVLMESMSTRVRVRLVLLETAVTQVSKMNILVFVSLFSVIRFLNNELPNTYSMRYKDFFV